MSETSDKIQNNLIRLEKQELTRRSANLVRRGLKEISKKEFCTITFKEDCEIGILFATETSSVDLWKYKWQLIGKATGKIVVPTNTNLILRVGPCVERYPCIFNDRKLIDLSPISQLNPEDLQGLDVSSSSFDSILPIKSLSHLQYLDASDTYICSLAAIESFPKLRVLNLSGTEIVDTEYLQCLTELIELDLSYTSIYDISYLQDLHQLEFLDICATPYCEKEIAALQRALPDCKIIY